MADISYPVSVTRKFYQKDANGNIDVLFPTNIGSEIRFVTPIKNTNLNSLEEQLLIGSNSITEEIIEEDGTVVTITDLRLEFETSDFYRIRVIKYPYDKDSEVPFNKYILTEESELCFIGNNEQSEIVIAQKRTYVKLTPDNKTIVKEEVINKLNN